MKQYVKIKKQDIICIIIILAIAVICYLGIGVHRKEGSVVVVYGDGQAVDSFSLDEEVDYTIQTKQGTNQLVISNHKAKITQADCKDKLCVHQTQIAKDGETIVCLPHKVVVQVAGGKEQELDGVVK